MLPNCLICKKSLTDYRSKYCIICFPKTRKDKPRGGMLRIGKTAPCYKDGRTLKNHYCVDCGKKVIGYKSLRCTDCWGKSITGKNNVNYAHGEGYKRYPILFNNRLKLKIRERDGFKCQCCRITEKAHFKRFKENLHVHHIDYNKQNCKEDNLITTCKLCNVNANFDRDYWFAYYTYIMENK